MEKSKSFFLLFQNSSENYLRSSCHRSLLSIQVAQLDFFNFQISLPLMKERREKIASELENFYELVKEMTLQRQNKDVTELKEILKKDRERISGST